MIEGFKCNLKTIQPIARWLEKDDDGKCPPCMMAPLASYYLGVLKKAGETKKAQELEDVFAKGDILTLGKKLDTIKSEVGEAIKKDLLELDCFAQSYSDDDDA